MEFKRYILTNILDLEAGKKQEIGVNFFIPLNFLDIRYMSQKKE